MVYHSVLLVSGVFFDEFVICELLIPLCVLVIFLLLV